MIYFLNTTLKRINQIVMNRQLFQNLFIIQSITYLIVELVDILYCQLDFKIQDQEGVIILNLEGNLLKERSKTGSKWENQLDEVMHPFLQNFDSSREILR